LGKKSIYTQDATLLDPLFLLNPFFPFLLGCCCLEELLERERA
jgi:hypothetical protein